MSNRPRTVRYFPKMKVRGAWNRYTAEWQRLMRSFDQLGFAAETSARHIERFGLAVVDEAGPLER